MTALKRRLAALCAAVVFLSVMSVSAAEATEKYLDGKINSLLEYEYGQSGTNSSEEFVAGYLAKNAGTSASDWFVIALSKNGGNFGGKAYAKALKSAVSDIYAGGVDNAKITELQRIALAYTACSGDIRSIDGKNLLKDCTYGRTVFELSSQGFTTLVYGLIVLDSKGFYVPKSALSDRDGIINEILSKQQENGGFSLSGNGADPDVTAMAVTALAPYVNSNGYVKSAVDKALDKLSSMQREGGGFASYGKLNCESCAQVIAALTSLGIDPCTDERFIKNGNTVLDGMLSFQLESGGFAHLQGGKENQMACYEALYALTAYKSFIISGKGLYDYSEKENSVPETAVSEQNSNSAGSKQVGSEPADSGNKGAEKSGSSFSASENALQGVGEKESIGGENSRPEDGASNSVNASEKETQHSTAQTAQKSNAPDGTGDEAEPKPRNAPASVSDSTGPVKNSKNGGCALLSAALCCLPLIAGYCIIFVIHRKGR